MQANLKAVTSRYTVLSILVALLRSIRLNQVTKNLFLFAALLFTGQIFHASALRLVLLAFLLFTLTAGSIYLLNDLLDVKGDRQHPRKCKRPIASGALPIAVAWPAMVVMAVCSVTAGFFLTPDHRFGLALLAYLVMQVAYCFFLKHQVLIDVFTIAAGFVIRVVAGALVIDAHISHWLLLCSMQLALFLGFGKRRQELVLMGENAGQSRAILGEYSLKFLDQMINLVCAMTLVCYSVYSVESDTAKHYPHLYATVPFVIYGICRYLYLVYQKGEGGAPDEVLLRDRMLQIDIVLWLLTVLALFMFDGKVA